MTWLRVALWVLLSAIVIVILGGYVYQWYRSRVSDAMDSMFAADESSVESMRVDVERSDRPLRTVGADDDDNELLDTGYVSD